MTLHYHYKKSTKTPDRNINLHILMPVRGWISTQACTHGLYTHARIERDRRLSQSRERAVTDLRVTDVGGTWTTNKVQNEGSILSAF